jgi:hypothetical protein
MDQILYSASDGVAVITLNRPERANAQTMGLLDDLDAAWTRAADDDEVRVIVLRGNGKHFSSGHDLKDRSFPAPDKITLESIYRIEARRYLEYSLRWRNTPKPSIAAVQGKCIAGGLLLCWPCDLIVAVSWISATSLRPLMPPAALHQAVNTFAAVMSCGSLVKPTSVRTPTLIWLAVTPWSVAPEALPPWHTFLRLPKLPPVVWAACEALAVP